jgi:hypothetical protein
MIGMVEGIVSEIRLGDERLNKRFVTLVETFAERPAASIPEASVSWSASEAAYRFFDNEAVQPGQISLAMAKATAKRCEGLPLVLAVQDTSSLDYTTHTDTTGLGPLENPKCQGLFVHTALVVDPQGGVPQGVIGQQVWARDPETIGKRHRRKELPVEAKESALWLLGLKETEERLGPTTRVLTVADREADVYELFSLAHELKGDWLIRARHDRNLVGDERHLLAVVEQAPIGACTTVELPRTDEREARRARLNVRRAQIVLVPPRRPVGVIQQWWADHPEVEHLAPRKLRPVQAGVVLVDEVDVPEGVKPVRWLLLTSLLVETAEQALACVGYYRLRWLIERYHYVLKSGCGVEKLQLETAERLHRALAVYSEVAWRLLWLTYEVRAHPDAPCTEALDDLSWQVLSFVDCPTASLPTTPPDLQTAVRKIAMLGGFLGRKGDGMPGAKTLWRGLRRLNDMVAAYRILKQHPDILPPQLPSQPSCV